MLARVFEEAGITTVTLALLKEHAERVKPPRALFVPFPFGYSLGRANDPEFQHRVISSAFDLLKSDTVPVLDRLPVTETVALLMADIAPPTATSPAKLIVAEITAELIQSQPD